MQSPTDEQRCSVRKRPNGSALMYQSWTDLLFLHWRIDPAIIQNLLPAGLFVDCFQQDAFIVAEQLVETMPLPPRPRHKVQR